MHTAMEMSRQLAEMPNIEVQANIVQGHVSACTTITVNVCIWIMKHNRLPTKEEFNDLILNGIKNYPRRSQQKGDFISEVISTLPNTNSDILQQLEIIEPVPILIRDLNITFQTINNYYTTTNYTKNIFVFFVCHGMTILICFLNDVIYLMNSHSRTHHHINNAYIAKLNDITHLIEFIKNILNINNEDGLKNRDVKIQHQFQLFMYQKSP